MVGFAVTVSRSIGYGLLVVARQALSLLSYSRNMEADVDLLHDSESHS